MGISAARTCRRRRLWEEVMAGVILVRRARIRRGVPMKAGRRAAWPRIERSRPPAVIPARDDAGPLARRFSACAVAGAAAAAMMPPGRPQSRCPAWRPDGPDRDGHPERSARPARARAIRYPALPDNGRKLTSEPGVPQRNSPGKPGSGPGKGHLRLLQRLQPGRRYR
jgi:hypothetical protein